MKILSLFVLSVMLSSCLYNYPTTVPTATVEKDSKEDLVKSAVSGHSQSAFAEVGDYKSYQFGQLFLLKPTEIEELDQLIEMKNQLPLLSDHYGDKLDSVIASQDSKIENKKKEIKENNIFPWYEINNIFSVVEPSGDSTNVYEFDFEVYPNYKIKDVSQKMKVRLSKKEYKSFKYFVQQNPLYTNSDYTVANYNNEKFYKQAIASLEAEQDYKGELLRTILHMTDYVIKKNKFDEADFALSEVTNWEKNNLEKDYTSLLYKVMEPRIVVEEEIEEIVGYVIKHEVKRSVNEKDVQSNISYNFDLNFVLISVNEGQ